MRWLTVDRSSARPGMAVFDGKGALLFGRVWDGEPTRAPEWIAELAQELADHGVAAEQLDGFVCGLGPGSFSGIRACLSALQGLALPGGKPVYGVASAAALALGQAEGAACVTVIGDARRNRLWSVTYRVDAVTPRVRLYDGRVPTHTSADFCLVPADALAQAVPAGTRIVSSDWERISGVLCGAFAAKRLVPRAAFPTASDVGRLALSEPAARVLEPLPVYLHPAVATAG
ncbi:MAG: tRNA (adenosine(37)-N6)-threonylcarbamoyltransferase complex dimerization subunit type 1 TsaB [bacterium]